MRIPAAAEWVEALMALELKQVRLHQDVRWR